MIEKFKTAISHGIEKSKADPWEPFTRLVREANKAIDQCAPSPEVARARLRFRQRPARIVIGFPDGCERLVALVGACGSVAEAAEVVASALSDPDVARRLYASPAVRGAENP